MRGLPYTVIRTAFRPTASSKQPPLRFQLKAVCLFGTARNPNVEVEARRGIVYPAVIERSRQKRLPHSAKIISTCQRQSI